MRCSRPALLPPSADCSPHASALLSARRPLCLPAEAIQIPDELSIALQWKGQKKEWSFDAVFGADTPQEKVFEDTKHLIQSAVDGYNVCIFACGWCRARGGGAASMPGPPCSAACMQPPGFAAAEADLPRALRTPCRSADGQTGSGKTFTIYGNDKLPGLTPKGVTELFHVMDRDSGGCRCCCIYTAALCSMLSAAACGCGCGRDGVQSCTRRHCQLLR